MEKIPVIDLHEDVSSYFLRSPNPQPFNKDVKSRQVDIPKYRRAGLALFVGAVFPSNKIYDPTSGLVVNGFKASLPVAWNHIAVYHRMIRRCPRDFYLVESRSVLEKEFGGNRIGILIGLEGAYPIEDPYDLELYYKLGVRLVGLTWNNENKYAASCMSKKDYGLTGSGETLVGLANSLGVIVDLAHASKNTMLDVLSITSKPVVISHACVRRIRDHPRNVDDEVLDALKRNRGVIGVTFVAEFVGEGRITIDDLVRHFTYLKENYSADIIALGTDYMGTSRLPEGLETIEGLPKLFEKLLENGFTREDLEKIAWRNAYRVIKENLK